MVKSKNALLHNDIQGTEYGGLRTLERQRLDEGPHPGIEGWGWMRIKQGEAAAQG